MHQVQLMALVSVECINAYVVIRNIPAYLLNGSTCLKL